MSLRTSPQSTCGTARTPSGGDSWAASRCRSRSTRNRSSTISSPARGTSPRAGTWKAARCSSKPGWRVASAAPRAAMTRWCSAPRSATTRASSRRSAWKAKERRSTFKSAPTATSTARASFRFWRSPTGPRRPSNGYAGRRIRRLFTPASSTTSSASRSTRCGTNGSRSSTSSRAPIWPRSPNIR